MTFKAPPETNGKPKKGTPEAVRATLAQAIERLGGFTATAAACGLTEYSIRNWLKAGCLNNVSVEPALKFAHAVKIPLDDFVIKD